MTLEQMLTLTDASVKNEQSEEVKISWIREVEGRILSEIHRVPLEDITLPQSNDVELVLPESYARVYLLYITAMIEFTKGNYSAYEQIYHEFESALAMYAKYYIRNRK